MSVDQTLQKFYGFIFLLTIIFGKTRDGNWFLVPLLFEVGDSGNQGSINDVRRERGAFPGGTGLSGLTVGCDRPFTYKLPVGRVSVK